MVTVNGSQVNFQDAVEVVPASQSFLVPVPKLTQGCVPLIYPLGDKKAGEPILDSHGNALEGEGVIFFNEKNKSWQGVQADGTGVIVFNNVSQAQAKLLMKRILTLTKNNPDNLTADNIRVLLKFAHSGAVEIKDVTQSDIKSVDNEMTMMSHLETGFYHLGMFTNNNDNSYKAVRYVGEVSVKTSDGEQNYPSGCVLVKDQSRVAEDQVHYSSMKTEAFSKAYVRPSGAPLGIFDIPVRLTQKQVSRVSYSAQGRGSIAS